MGVQAMSLIILVIPAICISGAERGSHFEKSSLEVSPNVTTSEEGVTIPAFSALQCASACVAMETCVAISYREEDQLCLLRDEENLSGPEKNAQPTETVHYKRVRGNTDAASEVENARTWACSDYWMGGHRTSGPYRLTLPGGGARFTAVCDFQTEGGPWTVFQRRMDGSENFYRNWSDYQVGFGSLQGEFWLGNDFLHSLTASGWTELRVELEDFEGERRYAAYSSFSVASAFDNYRLTISGYNGTAGDGMSQHNGSRFSTFDHDLDSSSRNCAERFHGAWWYTSCHFSNLNGAYLRGSHTSFADGVDWRFWRGYHYSLKVTEMKLRKPIIS